MQYHTGSRGRIQGHTEIPPIGMGNVHRDSDRHKGGGIGKADCVADAGCVFVGNVFGGRGTGVESLGVSSVKQLGGKSHCHAGFADVEDIQTRSPAIPPFSARAGHVAKAVVVVAVKQILGVAIIRIMLQVKAIIRLLQGTLVMLFRSHFLIVVAAQLIDMPNGKPRCRQGFVASLLLPVLDNEILRRVFGVKEKVVVPGGNACLQAIRHGRRPRGPAGLVFQIGTDLRRVFVIGAAITHQAIIARPSGLVTVIVQIGKIDYHVSVLMAKCRDGQRAPHVGDLVVIGQPAGGQLKRRGQSPRVRPQPLAPIVDAGTGVKDVYGVNILFVVGAQWAGVKSLGLEAGQGFQNQFTRPAAKTDLWICVVSTGIFGGVIGRDDIGVFELVLGIVNEIVKHRSVVAIPRIAWLVAKIGYLRRVDRAWNIGELDKQAQADKFSHRVPGGRRGDRTAQAQGLRGALAANIATALSGHGAHGA